MFADAGHVLAMTVLTVRLAVTTFAATTLELWQRPTKNTGGEFLTLTLLFSVAWCLMSTETIRLIRDGEKGGMRYGGGGRGRLYTYRYTVTTRMIPALRWATMRAILMFQ